MRIIAALFVAVMILMGAPVITGQNKTIRDRIIRMNSLIINCERRETG